MSVWDDTAEAELRDQHARLAAQAGDVARLTAAVFDTQAGRVWLARFYERVVMPASYSTGATFDHVAFREGQKDIYHQILRDLAMVHAAGGAPHNEQGNTR